MSNTDKHKDDKAFVELLEKTMKSQGRKWVWLAQQLDLEMHDISYKRENFNFTVAEEDKIKEVLGLD